MSTSEPPDEEKRLEALRWYEILDTPPEQPFDDLVLLAAFICETPMAAISLVDDSRQWFKAKVGLNGASTPREIAFCMHAILEKDRVLHVPDATADERFARNPLVVSGPQIRFYAGAPLVSPDGHSLGAISVLDHRPRLLSPGQLAALETLSRQVMAQLELRRRTAVLNRESAERQRVEKLLLEKLDQLSESKYESEKLLKLAEKSRLALLSVLEDEKLAGQFWKDSEERFRQLADNINEVFWMTDQTKDRFLYVSPAYEKIWGRTCRNLYESSREWTEAIHRDDANHVAAATADILSTGFFDVEYRILRPDKTIRWIHDRGVPIRNATGEFYRIAGTAEDFTERRQIEDQLRQSQKLEGIGQLAGGVAHDFNNILAVIQMQSELLRSSGGLSPDQTEFADEIEATVQRAGALTRQLLLFSRREIFQPHDLDLGESITTTAKMLMRVLGENVRMQLKLADQPTFIHADSGMMDQVLLNLAVNARDAMPDGGDLIIETSGVEIDEFTATHSPKVRVGSFVCLSVTDTGSGIPEDVLPKIFEPFYTTKGVGKGTGLGLATVFGIVQQHQGWINVYTENGHGTTFKIFLPRLAGKISLKSATGTVAEARGGHETILLVEDDPALRSAVRKALSQHGYRILEAPTGAKALEVWKQNADEVSLLLTDLVMPDGMSGKDLALMLMVEAPDLKVIYMSGYSSEVVGKEFPLTEGVNFLSKPFQGSKLVQIVRDKLDSAPGRRA